MPPFTGPPMDLCNMRSLGVTKVMAYCRCGHEASIEVSAMSDDVYVPTIKDRLQCTRCGERSMETRPDWWQYHVKGKMER
jgi:hypothetical protein